MAALLAVVRHVDRGDCRNHSARLVPRANHHKATDADLATAIAEEVLAVLRPIDAAKRVFPPPPIRLCISVHSWKGAKARDAAAPREGGVYRDRLGGATGLRRANSWA